MTKVYQSLNRMTTSSCLPKDTCHILQSISSLISEILLIKTKNLNNISLLKPISKTHSAWKKFLNETPERYELSAGANNDKIARLNSDLAKSKSFSYGLASGETANSGIGADFAQRPVMALT